MSSEPPSDPEELLAYLSENDMGDGLPVVPPTDNRVKRTIEAASEDSEEVLLEIPTDSAPLSVDALARCAVMAGCKPEYFPAVVAAFEGLAKWEHLRAPLVTTSGFSICTILNGPVREEWDVNCGTGLFGPGYRANATIGRAVNLAFMVVGEVFPVTGTMATHTHPGRYTYCFAENEEGSAWCPLHADHGGLNPGESAVTVAAAQAPQLVGEGDNTAPEEVLDELVAGASGLAATRSPTGSETIFVLGADHAERLGESYDKATVKEYLAENATRATGDPLMRSPDDAIIVVAGGIGNWSSILRTWPPSEAPVTTEPIE